MILFLIIAAFVSIIYANETGRSKGYQAGLKDGRKAVTQANGEKLRKIAQRG